MVASTWYRVGVRARVRVRVRGRVRVRVRVRVGVRVLAFVASTEGPLLTMALLTMALLTMAHRGATTYYGST